jgi:hypothetical protein
LDANGNESAVSNMVGEFDWSTESVTVALPVDGSPAGGVPGGHDR